MYMPAYICVYIYAQPGTSSEQDKTIYTSDGNTKSEFSGQKRSQLKKNQE